MKFLNKLVCGTLSMASVVGMSALPAMAKTTTYKSYDFNRDGKKDRVSVSYKKKGIYERDEDYYYDNGFTYKIYFNGRKIYSHTNHSLTGLSSKVIKLKHVTLLDLILKDGNQSKSVLYRLDASKAKKVLSTDTMFRHKDYFNTYSNPVYRSSGNTIKVEESNANNLAVGGFKTTVYYEYKNGSFKKKHSIYNVYHGSYPKYLKAKKKLTLYKSYLGKKKAGTIKKKQEVRLLKLYDGKSTPRFYVSVKGSKKKGWIKALSNKGMNEHAYFTNNTFSA